METENENMNEIVVDNPHIQSTPSDCQIIVDTKKPDPINTKSEHDRELIQKNPISDAGNKSGPVQFVAPSKLSLETFREGCWLDDEVMNAFITRLQNYAEKSTSASFYYGDCYCRPILQMHKMRDPKTLFPRTWPERLNLPSKLLFVNNVENIHWNAYLFDTQDLAVYFYCSLGNAPRQMDLGELKEYVELLTNGQLKARWWKSDIIPVDGPRQTTSGDCGVYVLLFMYAVTRGLEISNCLSNNDMEQCRAWIRDIVTTSEFVRLFDDGPELRVREMSKELPIHEQNKLNAESCPPRCFEEREKHPLGISRALKEKASLGYYDQSFSAGRCGSERGEVPDGVELVVISDESSESQTIISINSDVSDAESQCSSIEKRPIYKSKFNFKSIADLVLVPPPPIVSETPSSSNTYPETNQALKTVHPAVSLEQWINVAREVTIEKRKQLVISGLHQKAILPISFKASCMGYSRADLTHTIDIDSILWTGQTLPVCGNLKYFPFPDRNATLRFNNHITVQIKNVKGKQEEVKLSSVPNFELGTCGDGGCVKVLIFLPLLRSKKGRWVNYVKAKYLKRFYDKVMLPALKEVLPDNDITQFPPSYDIAQGLSCGTGGFRFSGKWIPGAYLPQIFSALRKRCEADAELSVFRDHFFHIYAKDLKVILRSSMDNPLELLRKELTDIDWDSIDKSKLFLDIGVEIFPKSNSGAATTLLWKAEAVKEIFKLSGMKMGTMDRWCFTSEIAGLRAEARKWIQEQCGVIYMQAYMSEKQSLYSHDKGRGPKKFSIQDVLNYSSKMEKSVKLMKMAWEMALTKNYGARIEYRVHYRNASAFIEAVPANSPSNHE
ncbi:uncharacterized protein VTP21DRAFT_9699 [Calcarisporiella thermophila]|uniref:uncharacterized protein n=1 Tax=Calcarisporiella thermophila TaxID=911321 RepID=UPI003743937F